MMDNHQIHEAMSFLEPQLVQEAAHPVKRKKTRLRPVLLAACLVLLIAIPVMAVTGSLLVEHYYGAASPDNLSDQNLDAFFRASTADKVPISALSQEVLDAAAAQEDKVGHYGFETWDEAEAFLGLNILDSDQIQIGHAIPLTDAEGQQIFNAPCHLTLLRSDDGQLYSMYLDYYFKKYGEGLVSLSVNAVTDQFPGENNSSIGVSNDSAFVLQQISEDYLTASGDQATIIGTEYSDNHGWNIAGWVQKNGFVIRFSLSTHEEESGMWAIRELLDSIQ